MQNKHFIYADGKLIALNIQSKDEQDKLKNYQTRYLHYDALNSVDLITDGYGLVVERRSYDTWGKQRKVTWRTDDPRDVIQQAITNRGYTGHEEITEVGLVHMNGRVYDQVLGRFISPDPIIQAPYVTNSFNRYSYVMNNPLKYTDPTGFSWKDVSDWVSSAWESVKNFFGGGSNGKPSGNNGNSKSSSDNDDSPAKEKIQTVQNTESPRLDKEMEYLEGVVRDQMARSKVVSNSMYSVAPNLNADGEYYANASLSDSLGGLLSLEGDKEVVTSTWGASYGKKYIKAGTDGKTGKISGEGSVGIVSAELEYDTVTKKIIGIGRIGRKIKTPIGSAGAAGYIDTELNVGAEAGFSVGGSEFNAGVKVNTQNAADNAAVSEINDYINKINSIMNSSAINGF